MRSSTMMRRRRDASSGSAGSSATEQVKVAKKDVDNARSCAERMLADGRCIGSHSSSRCRRQGTVTSAGTGSCRASGTGRLGQRRACPHEVLPTSAEDRERGRGTARHQRSGDVASGALRVDDGIVGNLGPPGGVEHRLARLQGRDRGRTRAM